MRSYDVYGVGNALLDMVYEVDCDFLIKHKIEKGLMTLVDENRHNELLQITKNLKSNKSCGGSAANTMIAISQMGGSGFYSCKVANDEYGDIYLGDIKKNGLITNLEDGRPTGQTGKCLVFVTPDADRTMNTYLGITETFSSEDLRLDHLKNSQYLYIEGYLVTSESGRKAAKAAKEVAEQNHIKTAITLSDPGIVKYFLKEFKDIIGSGVDLIFCNEEEAISFSGATTVHDSSVVLKKYAKQFAITLGPQGVLVFDGKQKNIIPSCKVKALDTNGAGDLFAGAFLFGLSRGKDLVTSSKLACRASSHLVTKLGARLAKEEAVKIRKEILGE